MPEVVYSGTYRLTPTADREAVKISLLRPRGTLYWEGPALMAITCGRNWKRSKPQVSDIASSA